MVALAAAAIFAWYLTHRVHPASTNNDDETQIRQALETWAKAVRTHDTDAIMSMYAPEVIAYDIVPPLQYVGADAYRKDYD